MERVQIDPIWFCSRKVPYEDDIINWPYISTTLKAQFVCWRCIIRSYAKGIQRYGLVEMLNLVSF